MPGFCRPMSFCWGDSEKEQLHFRGLTGIKGGLTWGWLWHPSLTSNQYYSMKYSMKTGNNLAVLEASSGNGFVGQLHRASLDITDILRPLWKGETNERDCCQATVSSPRQPSRVDRRGCWAAGEDSLIIVIILFVPPPLYFVQGTSTTVFPVSAAQ